MCGEGVGECMGLSGKVCWRVGRGMGEMSRIVLRCGAPTHF